MANQWNNQGDEPVSGSESDRTTVPEGDQVRGVADEVDEFDEVTEDQDDDDIDDDEETTF